MGNKLMIMVSDTPSTVTVTVSAELDEPPSHGGITKINCQIPLGGNTRIGIGSTDVAGLYETVLDASKLVPVPVIIMKAGSIIQFDLSKGVGCTSIVIDAGSTVTVALAVSPVVPPVTVTVSVPTVFAVYSPAPVMVPVTADQV